VAVPAYEALLTNSQLGPRILSILKAKLDDLAEDKEIDHGMKVA